MTPRSALPHPRFPILLVPLVFFLVGLPVVHGLVTITVVQSTNEVTMTASGSLNLGGLTKQGNNFYYEPNIEPIAAEFTLGKQVPSSPLQDHGDTYRVASGGNIIHPIFGTGGGSTASSGSGSLFGFVQGGSGNVPPDLILVPDDYSSGGSIQATATFSGATIASLGMNPGQYVWSWGSGANADSIVMNIPDPGTGTGDPYEDFVSVIPDPQERDPEDDPDRDGIPNAIEFVLGGDPAATDDSGLLPAGVVETSDQGAGMQPYFKVTFRRHSDALSSNPTVEYSPDLADNWSAATDGSGGVKVVTTPGFHGPSIDRVEVFLPLALGPDGRLFARLRVVIP